MPYGEITCASWIEAKRLMKEKLNKVPNSIWAYRGQSDAKWDLEHSLERAQKHLRPYMGLADYENLTVQLFKRRAHHFLSQVPQGEVEWLALMQHHQAPTRLLDLTWSFYVAAYFALETPAKQCAIWAFNISWFAQHAQAMLKSTANYLAPLQDDEDRSLAEEWRLTTLLSSREYHAAILRSDQDGVFPVEVAQMNERVAAQRGLFFITGNPAAGFLQNLSTRSIPQGEVRQHVMKIILSEECRSEAWREMQEVNITRETLFPGLDGFAASLKYHIPRQAEILVDSTRQLRLNI